MSITIFICDTIYFKMCQMFIIMAIIYSSHTVLANESDTCECHVLQIRDPDGSIGVQNFTKQNDTMFGYPYYFSTKQNMISSDNKYWYYGQYNDTEKKFGPRKKYLKKISLVLKTSAKTKSSKMRGTIISLINVKSCLLILKKQIHPPCIFPSYMVINFLDFFPPSTPCLLQLCTRFFSKNATLHVYSNFHVS